jgi:hypothetical protein
MSNAMKNLRSISIFSSSNLGSNRAAGEGDHEGRPYEKPVLVGATFMVALRSEDRQ